MKAAWQKEITERAHAFWTTERRHALLGTKRLILDPAADAPLLRLLDLVHRDGSMPPQNIRKLMQVSHLLVLLGPPFDDLRKQHSRVRIVDIGCGSSSLTLVLAWVFKHQYGHEAEIVGIDRSAVVIRKSQERANELGLAVRFEVADAHTMQGAPHAVLALHACDTATDAALAFGIRARAELIAVAPCCHAELSQRWHKTPAPLIAPWQSPHLQRELAATMTDGLRMEILRAQGYDTTAMEFVPSEHTPKNTLLRARRKREADTEALALYRVRAAELLAGGLALERALL